MTAGEIFSRYYAPTDAALGSDGVRFRRRLAATFASVDVHPQTACAHVAKTTGVHIKGGGYPNHWETFFIAGELRDVLDAITGVWTFAAATEWSDAAAEWKKGVQSIFDDERMSYRLDERCGVRHRVDEAFERERAYVVTALAGSRYTATRAALDEAYASFDGSEPDTRGAIRHMFDAVETLFKLMLPKVSRLGASEAKNDLPRLLEKIYAGASLDFARLQAKSFAEWSSAAHMYRHAQGLEQPDPPSLELAIQAVGTGTAFLRWLAVVDNRLRQDGQ